LSAYEKATAKMSPFQLEEVLARAGGASTERVTKPFPRPSSARPSRFASIALALGASASGVLLCALLFNR
jgi:hypothetical protein